MSLLNEVRDSLAPVSERGEGSTPQTILKAILEISEKKSGQSIAGVIDERERRLRSSVITLLAKELKKLDSTEDESDELKNFIKVCEWVIRLGRILVSRERGAA